jgi:hypothetical protein
MIVLHEIMSNALRREATFRRVPDFGSAEPAARIAKAARCQASAQIVVVICAARGRKMRAELMQVG